VKTLRERVIRYTFAVCSENLYQERLLTENKITTDSPDDQFNKNRIKNSSSPSP